MILFLMACKEDYSVTQVPDRISVLPEVTDIGPHQVGKFFGFQLQINSVEGEDIPIVDVSVTNIDGTFFELHGPLGNVPKDEPLLIDFAYEPLSVGFHRAAITIVSESREPEITVQVRGTGAPASATIYPTILDFGAVQPGDTRELPVTLYNDGIVPLAIDGVDFTDPHFTLGSGAPTTLALGATTTLPVEFTATGTDPASGVMHLDVGEFAKVDLVALTANDCAHGAVDAYDRDHDGITSCGGDCDDDSAIAFPGAVEACNGADDDCDTLVDEETSCSDDDGDGVTEDDGDCNDGDARVSPLDSEVPDNGVDDDCDGVVDDGSPDDDGDGYSELGGDCDDSDPTVFPGAPELPDGADNDCDATIDEGTTGYDDDGDGVTEAGGDCDDTDATVYPSAAEKADWIDNDCDGTVDEGTVRYDDDGDGFTEIGGDCDDTNAAVSPGATEVSGNGIDDDCDGVKS
jgi:hypothetical protein